MARRDNAYETGVAVKTIRKVKAAVDVRLCYLIYRRAFFINPVFIKRCKHLID
jgi:hypothetical protein